MSYPMIVNCVFFALNLYMYACFNYYCYRKRKQAEQELRDFSEQIKVDFDKVRKENPVRIEE